MHTYHASCSPGDPFKIFNAQVASAGIISAPILSPWALDEKFGPVTTLERSYSLLRAFRGVLEYLVAKMFATFF